MLVLGCRLGRRLPSASWSRNQGQEYRSAHKGSIAAAAVIWLPQFTAAAVHSCRVQCSGTHVTVVVRTCDCKSMCTWRGKSHGGVHIWAGMMACEAWQALQCASLAAS